MEIISTVYETKSFFLATLVALDFTPVSKWDKGVKWDEIFKAPILWSPLLGELPIIEINEQNRNIWNTSNVNTLSSANKWYYLKKFN